MRIRQTEEACQKARVALLCEMQRQFGEWAASDTTVFLDALENYIDARIELAKPMF